MTSRVVLRVRGEREWRVEPLRAPPTGATLAALAEAQAVRLFVERVRDVQPEFELTSENALVPLGHGEVSGQIKFPLSCGGQPVVDETVELSGEVLPGEGEWAVLREVTG